MDIGRDIWLAVTHVGRRTELGVTYDLKETTRRNCLAVTVHGTKTTRAARCCFTRTRAKTTSKPDRGLRTCSGKELSAYGMLYPLVIISSYETPILPPSLAW